MAKLTQEAIKALQDQYGDIYEIEVDGHYGYLRKPDRKLMGIASALQGNPVRSNEALLNGCWVGGDEIIKTDDTLFMSVQGQLGALIEIKAVTLKKL